MEQRSSYTSAGEASVLQTNKVLRNTYMLLAMTLTFSAVCAGIAMSMGLGRGTAMMMSLGALVMIFFLNKAAQSSMGILFVFVFTGLLGASLGPMLNHYAGFPGGSQTILQALGTTALVFFGLSGYVLTTKKDFSFMKAGLTVGFFIAMGLIVAGSLFGFDLGLWFSVGMCVLAGGSILYQTSNLVNKYGTEDYIPASLGLFASLMLLFWYVLRIFMSRD